MNHRDSGFTLVELLVAAAVTVLIAASAGAVLRGITEADRRIDRRAELAAEARAAAGVVADALRNAHRPQGRNEGPRLLGVDDSVAGVPRDRVRFLTIHTQQVRAGEPESDVHEVEFGVIDPGDGRLPALVRRLDPTRNEGEDGGGVLDRIAAGVIGLNVMYHDGVDYRDDWPAELGWPRAVRMDLLLLPGDGQGAPLIVSRMVALDHGYTAGAQADEAAADESSTRSPGGATP